MKLSARSDLRRGMATIGVLVSLGLVMTAGGTAWAATGDADPGFGGALHGNVRFGLGLPGVVLSGLAVQSGGGIVSVGTVPVGATEDAMAYRLHADGTTDSRSGRVRLPAPRDADESASAVVAQRDGKVVVVGYVTDSGGFPDFAVWRLTSTGAIDKTFGTNGLVTFGRPDTAEVALDVALDRQGRIVVAGYTIGSDADIAVVRVTPTGTLDRTFNDGVPMFAPPHRGTDLARGVAVQPNGNIIVGGLYAGAVGNAVVRIIPGTPGTATPQAVLDPSFGGGGGFADVPGTLASSYPDVAVTTDGKILLLDRVPGTGGSVDGTVVRWMPASARPLVHTST
jgi:uncharacterized delta-60 repeat protein